MLGCIFKVTVLFYPNKDRRKDRNNLFVFLLRGGGLRQYGGDTFIPNQMDLREANVIVNYIPSFIFSITIAKRE